jgi:hypothetical protein
MFVDFVKCACRYIYSFCLSEYGKLKDDNEDDEKNALINDSFWIHITESFENTFLEDSPTCSMV